MFTIFFIKIPRQVIFKLTFFLSCKEIIHVWNLKSPPLSHLTRTQNFLVPMNEWKKEEAKSSRRKLYIYIYIRIWDTVNNSKRYDRWWFFFSSDFVFVWWMGGHCYSISQAAGCLCYYLSILLSFLFHYIYFPIIKFYRPKIFFYFYKRSSQMNELMPVSLL